MQYVQEGNFAGADLLLRQILKKKPNHSDSLRLLGVIAALQGKYEIALEKVERALLANPRNGVAYSNKGNILLALNLPLKAIEAQKKAIKLSPAYAEAYSNLGNAYQELLDYQLAIDFYKQAIKLEPNNYDFRVNLGNVFWRANLLDHAADIYSAIVQQQPSNADAQYYLAQIKLFLGDFKSGWDGYSWRWLSRINDSQFLKTSKPLWQGEKFEGCLYVWAEQGVGDQILHASILNDLKAHPQKKLVSVQKKLLPIFKRSFPDYQFIDRESVISEEQFDQHIPIGDLGKLFRQGIEFFSNAKTAYLKADLNLSKSINFDKLCKNKFKCGLSLKSSNKILGSGKSMPLIALSKVLELESLEFINLQHGDVSKELQEVKVDLDIDIHNFKELDLYENLEHVLSLIESCDIILTTSNSTAHMAGALGKEVLLLLPLSFGKFWYWHDVDNLSIWYPSVKIFKQRIQGDWTDPVLKVKKYLEDKYAA
jgi:hypothetical protein